MRASNTICRGPTRHLPRFTAVTSLIVSSMLASCEQYPIEAADGDEAEELLLGTTAQALGANDPKCFDWTLVEKTLTGGGEFLSPATYDPSGCAKAYRLNLVNYDGIKYNGGAVVGYGGAIPTTEATCTSAFARAYVWERQSNGTMTFIENVHRYGTWIVGYDNVGRCLPPVIHLEREAGIVPNGTRDYRVAMTARTGANVTVPVAFATIENHVISPINERRNIIAYQQTLNSFSGTNLEPWLKSGWEVRNTAAGQIACRRIQIDRGLHAFTRAALIKAGATAATVDARNTALGNIHTALCTTGGTTQNLYNAIKDYLTRAISLGDQLASALLNEMPSLGLETRTALASNLMAQIPFQALGNLVSKCDLEAAPLMRYVLHGTLPAGVTDATRVVLGGCSGQSPANAAALIGFGSPTPGGPSNGVRAMAQCMADLTNAATETRCNSPRSQGAPQTPAPDCKDPQTGETGCDKTCYDENAAVQCVDPTVHDQVEAARTKEVTRAAATAAEKLGQSNTSSSSPLERVVQLGKDHPKVFWGSLSAVGSYAFDWAKLIFDRKAIDAVGDEARNLKMSANNAAIGSMLLKGVILGFGIAEVFDIAEAAAATDEERETYESDVRAWCDEKPTDPLGFCDQYNGPEAYCPADPVLPSNGWYEVGAGGPGAHQANVQDLFEHCLCNLVDSDYGAIGNDQPPSRAPALTCPSSKEQRKLACVADPRLSEGPDGEPDPECKRLLAPVYDNDAWNTQDCFTKLCPSNQRPFAQPDGTCACGILDNPTGPDRPDCTVTPIASVGLCTQDAPENCFCAPLAPWPPNGGDPFCRYDTLRLAGPISNWVAPAGAVHAEVRTATTQVARVRAGGKTQFVYPTLFPNSFAKRGPTLRQQVVMNRAPATSENVELKMYYTNRARNIQRQPMNTCNMRNLPVGSVGNCDFALPVINGVNASTFEEPFELEMELNTAATYKTRPALGALSYAGILTETPVLKLPPVCSPGRPIVDVINPIVDWSGLIDPNQTYPFPDGTALTIPLSIYALR